MGMFDDITCKFPLPFQGANGLEYQTKDTPAQYLDKYEIREDGTLWHEDYDTEDHSERGEWMRLHPNEEPPERLSFFGCCSRINKRWEQVNFTGEIVFYAMYSNGENGALKTAISRDGWIQWSAYFVAGNLNQIHLTSHRPAA